MLTTGYLLGCLRHRGPACSSDVIMGGVLTAEGTHPTGEFAEAREGESFPVLIAKKGNMVEFQLPYLG